MNPANVAPPALMADRTFREGFACLAPLDLSFDAWLYHPQIDELTALARAFPETRIVLNHVGGPIAVGAYAGRREEVFGRWATAMRTLATCPNVYVKLGGLGMRIGGFDFHEKPRPPSSEALAAAWRPCIEAFGAARCMFESNFPVDKGSAVALVVEVALDGHVGARPVLREVRQTVLALAAAERLVKVRPSPSR